MDVCLHRTVERPTPQLVDKRAPHRKPLGQLVSQPRHTDPGMRHDIPHDARHCAGTGSHAGHRTRLRHSEYTSARTLQAFPGTARGNTICHEFCRQLSGTDFRRHICGRGHCFPALHPHIADFKCRRFFQSYLGTESRPKHMAQTERLHRHAAHSAGTHALRKRHFNTAELDTQHAVQFQFHDSRNQRSARRCLNADDISVLHRRLHSHT